MKIFVGFVVGLLILGLRPVMAGEADIVAVGSFQEGGVWRFEVTVSHADTGWQHYANSFEVLAPDGTVLGTRILTHPHVNEQPFTRSLGGVVIPVEFSFIMVRGHDLVHGFGGKEIRVDIQ